MVLTFTGHLDHVDPIKLDGSIGCIQVVMQRLCVSRYLVGCNGRVDEDGSVWGAVTALGVGTQHHSPPLLGSIFPVP